MNIIKVLESDDVTAKQDLYNLRKQKGTIETQMTLLFTGIVNKVNSMPDEDFWPLIEALNNFIKKHSEHNGVHGYEDGIDAFLYDIMIRREQPELALSFVKTYGERTSKLYHALNKIFTGCGDDTYGDTIDSFPLHGPDAYKQAMSGEIRENYRPWYKGENYVEMRLMDKARDYYACICGKDEEDDE